MQFDPIKPTVKVPGTKHLTLKYDEPPSKFAFNFNLRHYVEVRVDSPGSWLATSPGSSGTVEVGSGQSCLPRHTPSFKPSFLELNCIL